MLGCKESRFKVVHVLTDEEGNAIVFEPVKQADGTYMLIGKMSTDTKEDTSAQD